MHFRNFFFYFATALVLLWNCQADAEMSVYPIGVAVSVENEDTLSIELNISNEGEEAVNFSVSYDEVDREEGRRNGPRRDDVEDLRVLIFSDNAGWGGEAVRPAAVLLEIEEITQLASAQMGNVDLDDFDVVSTTDSESNAYYQNWNNNMEMYEEWVADGGVLVCQFGGSGANPSIEIPGGVTRDDGATDGANVREEDCDLENPLIAGYADDDEDDFAARITGTSCSHQAFVRADFVDNDEIDNPEIFFVTEANANRVTIATYDYGRGSVCATTLTVSAHWNWHNGGVWMDNGPRWFARNQFLWADIAGGAKWFAVEPDEGELGGGDDMDLEVTFTPFEMEEGVYEMIVDIETDDPNQPLIQISAFMSLETPVADVSGVIYDPAENDDPIEGARLDVTDHFYARFSNRDGEYSAENVPLGDFEVVVTAEDYLPHTEVIQIREAGDFEWDVALLHSELELSEEGIEESLEPDMNLELAIDGVNDGNGPLTYITERRLLGAANVDPWVQRGDMIDAQAICEDSYLSGVVYVGGRYYISGGNGREPVNKIYILNDNGERVDDFDQFRESDWGMRDLTWDGNLIWGGDGNMIYGFTREGRLETSFESPVNPARVVAWDFDRQLLWVSADRSRTVFGLDDQGNVVTEVNKDPNVGTYGMSFYPDDPDEFKLYLFSRDGEESSTTVYKMNTFTGEVRFVTDLAVEEGRAGGLHITNEFDVYSWVFVGLVESPDRIGVWQVDARKDWMRINPEGGVIQAGGTQEFELILNSAEFPEVDLEGQIVFHHDGVGGETILPIILHVQIGEIETFRTLRFNHGWNTVSLNLRPEAPDIENMMGELAAAGSLILMKDGAGHFYSPETDFNNIPDWDVTQGYMVKTLGSAEMTVHGVSVLADLPIDLEEGWQLVSYVSRHAVDAVRALGGIEEHLLIAKDGFGNFYIPGLNFSNIGELREAQGYYLNVDEDVRLVYIPEEQDGVNAFVTDNMRRQVSVYQRPGRLPVHAVTGSNMSLLVQTSENTTGEIGVFTGGQLVGSGVIYNGLCGVAVWGDDPTTKQLDGARENEELELHLFSGENSSEVNFEVVSGDPVYRTNSLLTLTLNNIDPVPSTFGITAAYPNPFNASITLRYNLPQGSIVELVVYDIIGRTVAVVDKGYHKSGVHGARFSGEGLASGVYIIQLTSSSGISKRKVVLMK